MGCSGSERLREFLFSIFTERSNNNINKGNIGVEESKSVIFILFPFHDIYVCMLLFLGFFLVLWPMGSLLSYLRSICRQGSWKASWWARRLTWLQVVVLEKRAPQWWARGLNQAPPRRIRQSSTCISPQDRRSSPRFPWTKKKIPFTQNLTVSNLLRSKEIKPKLQRS